MITNHQWFFMILITLRCGSKIENAVKFAAANELLGIVAHSEDILRDINQVDLVKSAQLVLWTWGNWTEYFVFKIITFILLGEDNNCKETIKYLKTKEVNAIIYDKIDLLIDSDKVL